MDWTGPREKSGAAASGHEGPLLHIPAQRELVASRQFNSCRLSLTPSYRQKPSAARSRLIQRD